MSRPRPSALAWLVLSALLMALDQWSKHWALANLVYLEPVPVIDGWAWWTLVYNYGAAFSLLAEAGGWQRWFFTALAVVISAVLLAWLARIPRGDWRTALPLALVVAGALGNLVDRLRFGYVVDFIDVLYWPGRHWPAFNIADACIVVGAVLLVLFSMKAPAAPARAG